MDRRLQTLVLKKGHAKAAPPTCPLFLCLFSCFRGTSAPLHCAGFTVFDPLPPPSPQVVDVPSYLVRVDSEKHIDFAVNSPFGPR
jgi:hypothetical protein